MPRVRSLPPSSPAVPPVVPAGKLHAALRERWDRQRRQLRAVRRRFSHENVHETRVAARRLHAALALLSEGLGLRGTGQARRRLKKLLRWFAPVRDAQVQQALLREARLPGKVGAAFQEELRRGERKAAAAARKRVRDFQSRRITRAVARLDRELRRQADTLTVQRLRAWVELRHRRVTKLRDAVQAGGAPAIHRVRVAFKRFRYAVELVAFALPGCSPGRAEDLRRHQALMGAVQDASVALECFARFAKCGKARPQSVAAARRRLERRRDQAVARYLCDAAALDSFWPL